MSLKITMGALASKLVRLIPSEETDLTPDQQGALRARQLQSVLALGPIMVGANVANAAVLVWVFRASSERLLIWSWAAGLAVAMPMWAQSLRKRKDPPCATASLRSHRRLTLHALGMGSVWACVVAAFPSADSVERQVLELCVAGMTCGGAVVLAPVWSASVAFVAALLVPAQVMFSAQVSGLGSVTLLFGLSFGVVVLAVIHDRNRSLLTNFLQWIRLETSNAALATKVESFDAFGEYGFATDARGRVVRAAKRFADAEALARSAELALELAKNIGQDVTFFGDAADSQLREKRHLELLLIEAVERSQRDVHFEPLIDVASGRVVACETLLRWTHPVRGSNPPSVFVRLAEETRLIARIGEWVLNESCREAMRWGDDVRIAVNLSANQFRVGLVAEVAAALATSGLPPHRLELEITETALISDKAHALKQMQALRALGVKLSLDDFGTGYASLSYLADMPFDKIKIDRSFVREVASRHDSGAIVQAITDLAGRLGPNTTAEGVETLEDSEWLRAAGCKEGKAFVQPGRPSAPNPRFDRAQ